MTLISSYPIWRTEGELMIMLKFLRIFCSIMTWLSKILRYPLSTITSEESSIDYLIIHNIIHQLVSLNHFDLIPHPDILSSMSVQIHKANLNAFKRLDMHVFSKNINYTYVNNLYQDIESACNIFYLNNKI